MQLVPLHNVPIFEQLTLEEALLRGSSENWCLINTGTSPAIVLGISGKAEEHVEPNCPLPLIRRFSGGGTVVVDEETLFITFIGDMQAPTPCKIHCFIEKKLREALPSLPFRLRENDYILSTPQGDRKFGGNAQCITKNRFLHHTSLLWDWDPEKMSLLKMPPKQPTYREKRPHSDFLTPLKDHFPSKQALLEALYAPFSNQSPPHPQEIARILNTPHRKSLTYINF